MAAAAASVSSSLFVISILNYQSSCVLSVCVYVCVVYCVVNVELPLSCLLQKLHGGHCLCSSSLSLIAFKNAFRI